MEKNLYKYILQHTSRDQVYLLILTVISLPILYASLEVPKVIVNDAIGGQAFPVEILGYDLQQIPYLVSLCFAFLFLVILNGVMKYFVNVYRGVLGERMLRRFRYELYSRIQRFPIPHFKKTSQGEIIPMITAETEPLGGFIGDSFALPAFQGGVLITLLFFIFAQDVMLGLAAIALYPPQMYIIPKLQRKVNALSKRRVQAVRNLADKVGESVAGISEIHTHDTSHYERADIANRLGTIFDIRFEIFKRKFFIKFLNNFLAQLTPFFFYSIGGYFVIMGELSIGALVAVLAAYKDISDPWKELLKYYQTKEDIRVKYHQIIEQFNPEKMFQPELLDTRIDAIKPITGTLAANNINYSEDEFVRTIDGASFSFELDQHVGVIGMGGSGKDELGQLVARLVLPDRGRLKVDEQNLAEMPEAVLGRRMAYVGQNAYIFSGSIGDNIFYGLKHHPGAGDASQDVKDKHHQKRLKEARATGNSQDDIELDWLDYQSAGVSDYSELVERAIEVLSVVQLDDDIYQLGLRGKIDPESFPELAERILSGRAAMQQRLADQSIASLVELIDVSTYNANMTVAENLLFGTSSDPDFDLDSLAKNALVIDVLKAQNLYRDILQIGYRAAGMMADIFADVPADSELFQRFAFFDAEDLPILTDILGRVPGDKLDQLNDDDRNRLLALPFRLIPARHRLGLVNEPLRLRLLEARKALMKRLEDEQAPVVFFDSSRYNPAISIQDNILFGRVAYGQAHGRARVGELIGETVTKLGLRKDIIRAGFGYQVGVAGARLSLAQRQKLAFARSLIKQPDLLIVNEATGGLDPQAVGQLFSSVSEHLDGKGMLWVTSRMDIVKKLDRILVLDQGKVAEQGSFEELSSRDGVFKKLTAAEQLA